MADLGFEHVYRPGNRPGAPTLLLLHGTGGTEHDLIPISETIAADANVLSPRGKVLDQPAEANAQGAGRMEPARA